MTSTFESLLRQIVEQKLLSAVISSPWTKVEGGIVKVSVRPLMIKKQLMYQVSESDGQKVRHRNLTPEECRAMVGDLLPGKYKQGIFNMRSAAYHVLVDKQKHMTVVKKETAKAAVNLAHNRSKTYLLQEGTPIPFLIELGVMTKEGKVVAKKYDKFRQINRFVEMVSDVVNHLPHDRMIKIVDFGCGKAYLTFALYYYLHFIQGLTVHILGLDLKQDVIDRCEALAQTLNYQSLKFLKGDISHFNTDEKIDMVVSLHACDTATDAALEKAVRWGAAVILCVPCCQHELNAQIESQAFASLLRYGILKERFAALATDAARAELLTILGYDVQVLEFIDMEHTPKNLLLRAVKSDSPKQQQQARERYALLKEELQINPSLEKRTF
jgi:SAM-dependent methyltransferase